MHSKPKTLTEIAQAASDNNGGARGRQLGRIAERKGLTLSYTTVDKILSGTYTSRPSRKTLEALAHRLETELAGADTQDTYRLAAREADEHIGLDQTPDET